MRLSALMLLVLTWAAGAQAQSCRIALTLALDVSSSVDAHEYALQIEGLAAALQDAEVQSALFLIPDRAVALQVFEWSGERHQHVISDWMLVRDTADLDAMTALLRSHQRTVSDGQTALGQALEFAYQQLRRGPDCAVRKIDLSGDGQANVGILPQDVYWDKSLGSIIVNGLAIEANVPSLAIYFQNFVIRGPGAFVMHVRNYNDYAEAIRLKLVRELMSQQMVMAEPPTPVARTFCAC